MLALILDDNPARRCLNAGALADAGFVVAEAGAFEIAKACLRAEPVDLLILVERLDGRVSHALALMAEYRNPLVATILLTSRTDADVDELFLLVPSLHCLLAPDLSPRLLRKLAVASVVGATRAPPPLILLPSQRVAAERRNLPVFASSRKAAQTAPLLRIA